MTEIKVYTYGKRMKYNLEQYLNVLWERVSFNGSFILYKVGKQNTKENIGRDTSGRNQRAQGKDKRNGSNSKGMNNIARQNGEKLRRVK
ncbi:hypothetical protein RIR_jg31996.t1 [Rhizophagus irregularis DAOM 181602=DAOM 197198]|nr:hypothetical protein RIR_jg31996.t1 [Rhizophagus irregularis DAOM 181602=DAOM 197198]